ncbi:MAG: hypothetical protein WBE26_20215 [Phycisphaerae bacterium]
MMRFRLLPFLIAIGVLATGCIELRLALQDIVDGPTDGSSPTDGTDGEPADDADGNAPIVTLHASNTTPQVNEEVILTCSLVNSDTGPATFDFQPADGRLFVDHARGSASFIVEEADVSVAITLTCTATNNSGTSEPSNEQVITPTSLAWP